MERKSSDARIRANTKYSAKTYKRYAVNIRKEYAETIDTYCREKNISGSALFLRAAKYCIDNNINLSD